MWVTILLVVLFPFVALFLHWYYKVQYYEKYLKTIPGPQGIPVLGNILEFADTTKVLPRLMQYYDKCQTNFKVYIGAQATLFITEPKDLEFILSSSTMLKKSDVYNYMKNWLGIGLLTSSGNRWRMHRKIITPAFHFKILEEFIDVFNSNVDIMVSKLKKVSDKGSFDIYPYVCRCTLDIICETAMGISVNAQDDLDSAYVRCVNTELEVLTKRNFSLILGNELLYLFSKTYRKEKEALKVLHSYTKSVIGKRREELFSSNRKDESVDSFGRKKKKAFLDLLLEYSSQNPSFTEEDICMEVDTFMFAGHDTTATSIAFALYALAINPDSQSKAYAELQTIFSDDPNRNAAYKDLMEMKYLEMVIKESIRLYSTIPLIGRELEKEVEWNGMVLPKGLMLNLFIYGVHHSPRVYDNPEVFNPERFSIENSKGRHPYAYVPFSAGPRNCIGQKFAMLEMKSMISKVLRDFELLPPVPKNEIIFRNDTVLKSANGVYVRLRKRV